MSSGKGVFLLFLFGYPQAVFIPRQFNSAADEAGLIMSNIPI